jgi:hypothetical protein
VDGLQRFKILIVDDIVGFPLKGLRALIKGERSSGGEGFAFTPCRLSPQGEAYRKALNLPLAAVCCRGHFDRIISDSGVGQIWEDDERPSRFAYAQNPRLTFFPAPRS